MTFYVSISIGNGLLVCQVKKSLSLKETDTAALHQDDAGQLSMICDQ